MFKTLLHIISRILIGLFLLLLVIAIASFSYIYFNKEKIISEIKSALNKEVHGEITSEEITFDIFRNFPSTSVQIRQFSLRDSMFAIHKMELLHAENVFVKVDFKDLFASKIHIENITLENGNIFIFKDSLGYSNLFLLNNPVANNKGSIKTGLNKLTFKNFRIVYRDQIRNKFFSLNVIDLKCIFYIQKELIHVDIDLDGKIKFLGFNTQKGYYASNTLISSHIVLNYNTIENEMKILPATIYINNYSYQTNAVFKLGEKPRFTFELHSKRALYHELAILTTLKIQHRLLKYKFTQPVVFDIVLKGSLEPGLLPSVTAHISTSKNKFYYKQNEFSKVDLTAEFTNQFDTLQVCSDENSLITIRNVKAVWEGIPVNSDKILIKNIKKPEIISTIYSIFPLHEINRLSGAQLYNFLKGTGSFKFDIVAFPDSVNLNTSVSGIISINNGSVVYGPRSMPFNSINGLLKIKGKNVTIEKLSCVTGSSNLDLKGEAPGIIGYLQNERSDSQLSWIIKSSYINLGDFTSFLSQRKSVSKQGNIQKSKLLNQGTKLDNFLNSCKLNMSIDIKQIVFENFNATNLSGSVSMENNEWILNQINLNHADGSVHLNGSIEEISPNMHAVELRMGMMDVNITKVFIACDNFAQTSITDKNIEGILNSDIKLKFNMNNKAVIKQSSIVGDVDLKVSNGAIKGFQPLGKVSKLVFPKRDFTDIKFSELTNLFTVDGEEINFERMKINSSVMEMYIEGSYQLDGKTDLDIQVPLSNLKKRDWDEISENITDKGEKGMNVYIHAATDEKGELKFKYQPLKKIKDKGNTTIKKSKGRSRK